MAQLVSHPNLINLIGVCTVGEPILLILEYAEHGSLDDFLRKTPLSTISKLVLCKDIASGMQYIASTGFVHRDLSV
jgi:serine/threonine protein kinase